jgi:hypothetical protein
MSDDLKLKIGDEVPVTLTMQGPEKSGTNKFGNWYLYRFNHNGEKVAYFAKDQMHVKLKDLDANTKVTLVGKKNPQGKGVYVDMVLANGHTTTTPTSTPTTTTASITDTVVIAAASSLVGTNFTEEVYLDRCKIIAETFDTVTGYTTGSKVKEVEETLVNTFEAKPIDPNGPLPWEND